MEVSITDIKENKFIMEGDGFVKQHSGNYHVANEDGSDIEGYVAEGWVITKLGYMVYSYHTNNEEMPYITLSIVVDDHKYDTIIKSPDDVTDRKLVNKYANEFIEEIEKL